MDFKRFVWKVFSLQRDEYHFVLPLFSLYCLSGSFFAVGQIFSETLFLKAYGAKGFSSFFIQNGIAIIIAGIFYNYFLLKLPLRKGYIFLISFVSILIISSSVLQKGDYVWLPFYIYMGNYLFTFFLDIHFFNYAFQHLTLRNSKRILPFLMGGGKLGGIISSLLVFSIFSRDISRYGFLIWAINGTLLFIPILLLKASALTGDDKAQVKRHELLPDYKLLERIIRKVRLSISSKSFIYSVLIAFVMSIANQVSEYYFATIFNTIFETKNELSAFLSLYTLFADLLTLIVVLFIISRIIRRIGVRRSNLVYPASFFLFMSLCIAFPNLIIGILLRFYRKNLSIIIRTPIYNIILAASPRDRMIEVKSFISAIINPLGMIAGGVIILIIYRELPPMGGYALTLGIGILYLLLTRLQNREYIISLKNRISSDSLGRDDEGLDFYDYKGLVQNQDEIKKNLNTIEIFFNEKPTLELLPFLHPHFSHLSSQTKENILNILMTSRSNLEIQITTSALQDPNPIIRGKALSLISKYAYHEREKLLKNLHPNILKSEEYAISILLARGGRINAFTSIDDFVITKLMEIKNGILNGNMYPIEFVIFIQVLPYNYFLTHLVDLAIKARDIQFLKSLIPYGSKLNDYQRRKILYSFRNAHIGPIINFAMLSRKEREVDKATLLNYRDIPEVYIKMLFRHYNEKIMRIILNRLIKNKSYYAKSNYLKLILCQNRKPEKDIERFIAFEISRIREIYELKSYLNRESRKDATDKFYRYAFLNTALIDIIDLHKHLILKAIAILTGTKIDDAYESNILLRDRDLDNYIFEYIESSVKHSKEFLYLFEKDPIISEKIMLSDKKPQDKLKGSMKHLESFLPEISHLLKFCLSTFTKETETSKTHEDRSTDADDKLTKETIMLSLIEKIIFLKGNKLFQELEIHELIHIAKIAREIEINPDKIIINQGETGNQLFVLINGEVEVYTNDRVLAKLGPGSCIGELSIIDEEPRSANVKTTKKTKILSIHRKDFLLTLKENPTISINIMQVLTERLRGLIP